MQSMKQPCLLTQRKLLNSSYSVFKYSFTAFRRKVNDENGQNTICLRYATNYSSSVKMLVMSEIKTM